MDIVKFNYGNLTNEEHTEYTSVVIGLTQKYNPAVLGVQNQYVEYNTAYSVELSILDYIRKSEYTQKIEEQDRVRDRRYYSLANAVKSALDSHDSNVVDAAKRVAFVLNAYGNIAIRGYNAESAAIEDLVRELRDTRMSEILTLNLVNAVNALENENKNFRNLISVRDTEKAQKPPITMKQARYIVDRLFRSMRDFLEALELISPDPTREEFIKELNAASARFKLLADN